MWISPAPVHLVKSDGVGRDSRCVHCAGVQPPPPINEPLPELEAGKPARKPRLRRRAVAAGSAAKPAGPAMRGEHGFRPGEERSPRRMPRLGLTTQPAAPPPSSAFALGPRRRLIRLAPPRESTGAAAVKPSRARRAHESRPAGVRLSRLPLLRRRRPRLRRLAVVEAALPADAPIRVSRRSAVCCHSVVRIMSSVNAPYMASSWLSVRAPRNACWSRIPAAIRIPPMRCSTSSRTIAVWSR